MEGGEAQASKKLVPSQVLCPSGEVLQFEAEATCSIACIKDLVCGHLDTPASCHKLVAGISVLGDEDVLQDLLSSPTARLELKLMPSLTKVNAVLLSVEASEASKIEAVRALGHLGGARSDRVFHILLRELDGRCPASSQAAGEALLKIAEPGHEVLALEMQNRLASPVEFVRRTAVDVLGRVVELGVGNAVSELVVRLDQRQAYATCAVLEALAAVARRGDAGVVEAVCERAEDVDASVRRTALTTLAQVAEPGDRSTIAVIIGRFNDSDALVRETAVGVIAGRPRGGDGSAFLLERLLVVLHISGADGRCSAVRALAKVATREDRHVIYAVVRHLEDRDAAVRVAAVAALGGGLVAPDDEEVVGLVAERLASEVEIVREAGRQALMEIVGKGDERINAHLAAPLQSKERFVRWAAHDALQFFAAGEADARLRSIGSGHRQRRAFGVRAA